MAPGRMLGDHACQFAMQRHQPQPQAVGGLVAITPWAIWESRVPVQRDHAPAHAGEAGIEAEDANRAGMGLCTLYVHSAG